MASMVWGVAIPYGMYELTILEMVSASGRLPENCCSFACGCADYVHHLHVWGCCYVFLSDSVYLPVFQAWTVAMR